MKNATPHKSITNCKNKTIVTKFVKYVSGLLVVNDLQNLNLKNLTSFKGQPQTSIIIYLNKYTSNIGLEFGIGLGSDLGFGLDVRIRTMVRVRYD